MRYIKIFILYCFILLVILVVFFPNIVSAEIDIQQKKHLEFIERRMEYIKYLKNSSPELYQQELKILSIMRENFTDGDSNFIKETPIVTYTRIKNELNSNSQILTLKKNEFKYNQKVKNEQPDKKEDSSEKNILISDLINTLNKKTIINGDWLLNLNGTIVEVEIVQKNKNFEAIYKKGLTKEISEAENNYKIELLKAISAGYDYHINDYKTDMSTGDIFFSGKISKRNISGKWRRLVPRYAKKGGLSGWTDFEGVISEDSKAIDINLNHFSDKIDSNNRYVRYSVNKRPYSLEKCTVYKIDWEKDLLSLEDNDDKVNGKILTYIFNNNYENKAISVKLKIDFISNSQRDKIFVDIFSYYKNYNTKNNSYNYIVKKYISREINTDKSGKKTIKIEIPANKISKNYIAFASTQKKIINSVSIREDIPLFKFINSNFVHSENLYLRNCGYDNTIPVPWEFEYINDADKIKKLLKTDYYKDRIVDDKSFQFYNLIEKVAEYARYEFIKSEHHMWPEAYLVIPHTLQWKDGHIKIIRNPSAEPLSPSKTISYEALNMIKGEIQTELLTSLYGETFVTRLNVALFVINIADHLLKSKNDKELFDESQINPKLIYEKAVIEAKKLIINDLAQKMSSGGQNAVSLEFF
jgi:hypothetical protein